MRELKFTGHAVKRMHQRGIPEMAIDLLLRFGAEERAGKGSSSFFWDKASEKRLKAYAGSGYAKLKELFDCYVVVADDGEIITVAHRYK